MKLKIEINCDNAAFEDGGTVEIRRILARISATIAGMGFPPLPPLADRKIQDHCGNTVGTWGFESETP